MQKAQSRAYSALLVASIVLAVLALVTMLPNPGASKPNVLGYRSICTFAPTASALCCLLAAIVCTIRNRRFSRDAAAARYRPIFLPAGVVLLLVIVALVFGIRFGQAQARFGSVIAETRTSIPAGSLSSLETGTRLATASSGEVAATVEVTVTGGSITTLRLVEGKNVDQGFADTIFTRVREKGSLDVDAVSGATASSNVLLQAIGKAARAP